MARCFFLALGFIALSEARVGAQVALNTIGQTVTITFDSTLAGVNNGAFAGSGFQSNPTAGQLDSDAFAVTGLSDGNLAFGGTQTTAGTDYTRGTSTGGVNTGGIYAFNIGNRALGVQPAGSDFAPGTITIRAQNNTGYTVNNFGISYVLKVNNDQGRSNSFNFSYSTNNTTYTSVGALDYTSPDSADALGFVTINRSTNITGLSIANGAFFYIRFSGADVGGSGSRDEFAVDDISFTPTVPEPSTFVLTGLGMAAAGWVTWRRRAAAKAKGVTSSEETPAAPTEIEST